MQNLKNLKQQNATLIDQLSTYRAAAEELRDGNVWPAVSEQAEPIGLPLGSATAAAIAISSATPRS